MFYLRYIASELRRRKGRTFLVALGLGVGVAFVIAVNALSNGLDTAQAQVLRPLTGLGTDMSVTRPLNITRTGRGTRSRTSHRPSDSSSGRKVVVEEVRSASTTWARPVPSSRGPGTTSRVS